MIEVAFPYRLDDSGRTATATYPDHVTQMLEQLLFTRPGERVNQPELGCGLGDDVFGPNSPEVGAAIQIAVAAAIARWLNDVIAVTSLDVTSEESTLTVDLVYVLISTGAVGTSTVRIPGGS
jgi:phage baseplate assembly protein W